MATTRQQLAARMREVGSPALWAHHVSRGRYRIRPHIVLIDKAVRRAIQLRRNLAISLPPRHSKSETVSRYLPAWYLGTFPNRRVMLASYEASFAATWGGRARDLLEEHGPTSWRVRPSPGNRSRSSWTVHEAEGGMVTAGVGGPFTGKGADLAIIDDPIKNAADALSAVKREAQWEWYQSTLATRIEPGGVVIAMATRWHQADLLGRLLADAEEPWDELRIPAMAELDGDEPDPLGRGPVECPMCHGTGEHVETRGRADDLFDRCRGCNGRGEVGAALWPERYGELHFLRRMIEAPYWFAAMYQGRPRPVSGGMFRAEHRRRYRLGPGGGLLLDTMELVPRHHMTVFCTMDVAASERTSADWTVIATWGWDRRRGNLALLDITRRRQATTGHRALVEAVAEKWNPVVIGIERQTYGLALLQDLRTSALPVRPLTADTDKVARALSAAALYDNLQVLHPHASDAPWVVEYERELDDFPRGTHDDQVDTAGYAAIQVRSLPGTGAELPVDQMLGRVATSDQGGTPPPRRRRSSGDGGIVV